MEGRYPDGFMLAASHCSDPAKDEAFNAWYNHIHLPDWTAPGVFRHGIRFVNTDPAPADGHKYLATYETTWEDVAKAWEVMWASRAQRRAQERGFPEVRWTVIDVFKRLGGEFCAARKPVRGILAVMLNCTDPAKEEAFHRWYEDVHIPDILETGLFHTAYRYASLAPAATIPKGKYLAIYETDSSEPDKAGEELGKMRPAWERRGRLFDATERVFRITARPIWPRD
jgi:hypothetical protein